MNKEAAIKAAGEFLKKTIETLDKESGRIKAFFLMLLRYPVKMTAFCVFSPVLLLAIMIRKGNSFWQKTIAFAGFLIGVVLSLFIGSYIFKFFFFMLVKAVFGWISAIGLLLGSFFSVSVIACIQLIVFLSITTLFLSFTSTDVIEYLAQKINGK